MSDTLEAALTRHEICLEPPQVAILDRYCAALWKYNEQLNLTRHTDFEKFVTRDVVDSRVLAEFLQPNERVLDVGSGGGVPGVIVAIVRGDLRVELCESVAKRATALAAIVKQTRLDLPIHHARAEELLEDQRFDTLLVRAVAPLSKLLGWLIPVHRGFGRLLVIKGPAWVDERADARHRGLLKPFELRKRCEYPMPGTESQSVVLELRPRD